MLKIIGELVATLLIILVFIGIMCLGIWLGAADAAKSCDTHYRFTSGGDVYICVKQDKIVNEV